MSTTLPGDGRTECKRCGQRVYEVTHSCKGVPVTARAEARSATSERDLGGTPTMPDEVREKARESAERVVNEGGLPPTRATVADAAAEVAYAAGRADERARVVADGGTVEYRVVGENTTAERWVEDAADGERQVARLSEHPALRDYGPYRVESRTIGPWGEHLGD